MLGHRIVGIGDAPPVLRELDDSPLLVALDVLDHRGRRDRALHPPGQMLDRELPAERAAREAADIARGVPAAIGAGVCRPLCIADDVGELFLVDAAHFIGLVAGGAHPNPVEYADIVTATTHKTLRGPRGAMIMCREEHAKAIDKAVFPGWQGGPLMHSIAAKAVALAEAATEEFRSYAHQVVANARRMADTFTEEGLRIVSGGTDNHLMLVDLQPIGLTGKEAEERLDSVGITVNKNAIPYDPQKPFIASGIRVGTPAITTCGMQEAEVAEVARLIAAVLKDDSEPVRTSVRGKVKELTDRFRPYPEVA